MGSYREAQALAAEAAAAVHTAGTDGVLVTLDGPEAGIALQAGESVVLVTPPRVEYEGGGAITTTRWTLYAISAEYVAAEDYWPLLDTLADTLADTFTADETAFYTWRTAGGHEYPARQITFTT